MAGEGYLLVYELYCTDNSAETYGGCLSINANDIILSNSYFLNNYAQFGGVIYITYESDSIIIDT